MQQLILATISYQTIWHCTDGFVVAVSQIWFNTLPYLLLTLKLLYSHLTVIRHYKAVNCAVLIFEVNQPAWLLSGSLFGCCWHNLTWLHHVVLAHLEHLSGSHFVFGVEINTLTLLPWLLGLVRPTSIHDELVLDCVGASWICILRYLLWRWGTVVGCSVAIIVRRLKIEEVAGLALVKDRSLLVELK